MVCPTRQWFDRVAEAGLFQDRRGRIDDGKQEKDKEFLCFV